MSWYACAVSCLQVVRSKLKGKKLRVDQTAPSIRDQFDFNDKKSDGCDDIVLPVGPTPIYEKPTTNFQFWVNQYVSWFRSVFPKQPKSKKQFTDLANELWTDADGNIARLIDLIYQQSPKTLPTDQPKVLMSTQKRMGAYFDPIVKVQSQSLNPVGQLNNNGFLRNRDFDRQDENDENSSPSKPAPKTGGDRVMPKCISNSAEVMPAIKVPLGYYDEYTNSYEFPSDRFLEWLLGEDFNESMPTKTTRLPCL